jgi:SAM-dependent methyltransferase
MSHHPHDGEATSTGWLDRVGTDWRIRKASKYIERGSRVLDIGCGDGSLFRLMGERFASGVGVDPHAPSNTGDQRFRFIRESYPCPEELPEDESFDVIVCLAMLEHVRRDDQPALANGCFRHLRAHGRLILTVPSPRVDPIVDVVRFLHLGKGVACHEHFGYHPRETSPLFSSNGFTLLRHERFELGLNNLFVFEKTDAFSGVSPGGAEELGEITKPIR